MKRTVRSEVGEVTVREDGLVVARTFPNSIITLKAAKDYHQMIAYLTRNQCHTTVIDISGIVKIDADALEFLIAQSCEWGKTVALGLVATSFVGKMIAESFLTDYTTTYAVKVFKNMTEAQQWTRLEYLKSITRKAS